jgi:hypothetical protein
MVKLETIFEDIPLSNLQIMEHFYMLDNTQKIDNVEIITIKEKVYDNLFPLKFLRPFSTKVYIIGKYYYQYINIGASKVLLERMIDDDSYIRKYYEGDIPNFNTVFNLCDSRFFADVNNSNGNFTNAINLYDSLKNKFINYTND